MLRTLARADLARPAELFRRQARPGWPISPAYELDIELPASVYDAPAVDAMPSAESVFGTVSLGKGWLDDDRRSGTTVVAGHFVVGYGPAWKGNRPLEALALRLLSTAFPSSAEDLDYAACTAEVTWTGSAAHIDGKSKTTPEAVQEWIDRAKPGSRARTPRRDGGAFAGDPRRAVCHDGVAVSITVHQRTPTSLATKLSLATSW